jgi:two-component system phosphate regulon sensor histidine kinase PhoR
MLQSIRLRIGAALALLIAATFLGLATGSLIVAVLVAAVAAVVLALVLSAVVLSPLERITRTAASIAAGNLEARVMPRPIGEMGETADAFNQVAANLQEQIAKASQDHSRMLAALSSTADAVIALSDRDLIAFANPAAEQLLQRSQREMMGNPFGWAMADPDVVGVLRSSREQRQAQRLVVEHPAGRHLEVSVTPIIEGGDWASLVVFHDVTSVRRAERVRRDFVANVSHELRTPLAGLKSVIETLEGGALDDTKAAREFLARGDRELDRIVLMVEELLELSRIESGEVPLARRELLPADLLRAAVDRMRPQAERQGVQLNVDVPKHLPKINADRNLLERAIVNLIDNAIKFTPGGGAIDVSAQSDAGLLTVEVRDTGEGIDPADLPRIFERFYKADRARRAGGTGLGLAIVKHTIEAHAGTVSVTSEPGRGSTFMFSVPFAASDRHGEP